jgi:hypothetical protein
MRHQFGSALPVLAEAYRPPYLPTLTETLVAVIAIVDQSTIHVLVETGDFVERVLEATGEPSETAKPAMDLVLALLISPAIIAKFVQCDLLLVLYDLMKSRKDSIATLVLALIFEASETFVTTGIDQGFVPILVLQLNCNSRSVELATKRCVANAFRTCKTEHLFFLASSPEFLKAIATGPNLPTYALLALHRILWVGSIIQATGDQRNPMLTLLRAPEIAMIRHLSMQPPNRKSTLIARKICEDFLDTS